jgi:hypothetical protein
MLGAATDAQERRGIRRGLITGYRVGGEVREVMADTSEYEPVPPVAGYPTDRALLSHEYYGVFLAVDRRDGEMVVTTHNTGAEPIILTPVQAIALF